MKVPIMSVTRKVSSLILAAALGLGATGAALAHAHLKSSAPAGDSAVAAPATLELHFSEGVDLKFSGVSLTGPDQKAIATGDAAHAGNDEASLSVPVAAKLAPGKYTVQWHVLSKDGHKVKGSYSFDVKP
ncbi:copper homeostasis periplasmic binding protein CopC [Labrys sp. ZIDIC5]|uniref:copper homeostasis periplasmic binding protein CopC n=1 Tax=Labrys sedimenti TaxID=3106036 RepID=UPI002ACA9FD0|nr:copper homeostasis periplasmic binding protein CopC [Labrys sp. ZIDIC5]MDZ5449594.1 copper homeostasis periplasmic binding protein CopC [Labrys sp. ZIDIC5]